MFTFHQKVLFKHCDPAGIVFFPRYFEMINDCVETFFDEGLGWPFEELLKTGGIPTVTIGTDFTRPSFHGDRLVLTLELTKLGRTSLVYVMEARCGEELRFRATTTLVHVAHEDGQAPGRPAPWPDAIRPKLEAHLRNAP